MPDETNDGFMPNMSMEEIDRIMFIPKWAYKQWLRELLKNAINDPNSELDEYALKKCDCIFDYVE